MTKSLCKSQDSFWIGQVQDATGGMEEETHIVKHCKERECINGTSFTAGDYAISVKWLARDDADPERRTFLEDTHAEYDLFNSTELRASKVELNKVSVDRQSLGWCKTRKVSRLELPSESEVAILRECW